MKRITRMFSIYIAIAAMLIGCNIPYTYRMEVRQGNFMNSDIIKQLKIGQTKTQVRDLLGPPTIIPLSDDNRWEYYHRINMNAKEKNTEKRLTIQFKNDRVVQFQAKGL